ncbi:hypothetical protein D9M68_397910 [compost metagenome]
MKNRLQSCTPEKRPGWHRLAACALVALCTACTAVPDLLRPPKPRTAALASGGLGQLVPGASGIACSADTKAA